MAVHTEVLVSAAHIEALVLTVHSEAFVSAVHSEALVSAVLCFVEGGWGRFAESDEPLHQRHVISADMVVHPDSGCLLWFYLCRDHLHPFVFSAFQHALGHI